MSESTGAAQGGEPMNTIEQFVKTTSEELGETEGSTRAATAGLLEALREQATEEGFRHLIDALPGAEPLLHTHSAENVENNQNGIAGALGWIRGWSGGTSGDVAFLKALEEAGFAEARVAQFLNAFRRFATNHAGKEAVQKVFDAAPDLEIIARKGHT